MKRASAPRERANPVPPAGVIKIIPHKKAPTTNGWGFKKELPESYSFVKSKVSMVGSPREGFSFTNTR